MQLDIYAGFGGLFKMEVRKAAADELVRDVPWFHNTVLDSGLDLMAENNWVDGIAVGTGNSNPVATQTDLDSRVKVSTYRLRTEEGGFVDENFVCRWLRRTYRFHAGSFNNTTLAEVGIVIEKSGNPLWNRALIKDANGNPTTITLLADEYLDVTCEVRCYVSLADVAGSFNLVDKNGVVIKAINTITRPAAVNGEKGSSMWSKGIEKRLDQWYTTPDRETYLALNTEGIKNTADFPKTDVAIATWTTLINYIQRSHKSTRRWFFSLGEGNDANFLSATLGSYSGLYFPPFQIGFSEPIRKTASQTLEFTTVLSWGRYNVT